MTDTLLNMALSLLGGGLTYLALNHLVSKHDRLPAKAQK
jgi:hypothetical protein